MPELFFQNKNRPRAETTQGLAFKSSIFENKQKYNSDQSNRKPNNFTFFNEGTSNLSPLSNNSNGKTGIGNKDSNPENKIWNKQMASSSFLGYQHKNSVGRLSQMGRMVPEPVQQNNNTQQEKQKNKLSFLQVPKWNVIKPKNEQMNNSKIINSSINNQNRQNKAPSFLKKDLRNSFDPSEKQFKQLTKKQADKDSNKSRSNYGVESQVSEEMNKNPKKVFQPISPLIMGTKVSNISPINSASSYKNKSTNQPYQSPLNNNLPNGVNLLNPSYVAKRNQRKSSMIIQNERDFYTPTQKSSAKNGSSNFIQLAEKHNTAKHSNKSHFLLIHEQQQSKQSQCLSSRNEQKTANKMIPSFIKFKQKRNELMNNSFIEKKNSFQNTTYSFQSVQQKTYRLEDFEIKQRLGKGAFGDVFLVRQNKTGFFCVLKKLSKKKIKEQKLEELILREIKIQAYLAHKHLTSLYGFFDDQEFIYLILEYLSDGSLAQKYNRKKCPQKQVAIYLKQICEGLKFMHIENIIHRDIKPQNVFIHEDYIKIGDFGCSVCSDSKRNTVVGCLAYISPQQLNNQSYDDKIDVWSVGILCYELLTGRSPFQQDIIKIARQQKDAKLSELRFPTKIQISDEAKDFTKRLLQQIPENRMTIPQALKHPYILKNNLATESTLNFSEASLK